MYELRHSLTSKTQYTVCQKYEIVEIQKQMSGTQIDFDRGS